MKKMTARGENDETLKAVVDDVEWWHIERYTHGEATRYAICVFGELVTHGHHSLIEAINEALAVLSTRDAEEPAGLAIA